jgi:hypothetical protein
MIRVYRTQQHEVNKGHKEEIRKGRGNEPQRHRERGEDNELFRKKKKTNHRDAEKERRRVSKEEIIECGEFFGEIIFTERYTCILRRRNATGLR